MPVDRGDVFYTGNTIELEYNLQKNDEVWNLNGCEIWFILVGQDKTLKAKSGTTGEISVEILDAAKGNFVVVVPADVSKTLPVGTYEFEIAIKSNDNKRTTVKQDRLTIAKSLIDWNAN